MAVDLVWIWYLLTVSLLVAAIGPGVPDASFAPFLYVGLHLAFLVVIVALRTLGRDLAPPWRRASRGVFTLVTLPVVFSTIGLVLPAVHPEPYEWTWIAWDRALFGTDPTVALQAVLWPPFVELLQWVYASFYFIPIAALIACWRRGGGAAFDRGLTIVAFGFLLSYLGYFLLPTLPPYRFLHHEHPIEGVWLAAQVRHLLDVAETNRWDCMPSGHTMLSVVSLVLVWRHARAVFWWLLPIVTLLVFSTVGLRYHYVVDVLAGLLLVPVAVAIGGWLHRHADPPAEVVTTPRSAAASQPIAERQA